MFIVMTRMRLVRVPLDPKTHKADIKAMEKAINKNTCMVFLLNLIGICKITTLMFYVTCCIVFSF